MTFFSTRKAAITWKSWSSDKQEEAEKTGAISQRVHAPGNVIEPRGATASIWPRPGRNGLSNHVQP